MHVGEGRRNDRFLRSQELDEYITGIQVAQACGLNDAAQDLLRRGAARRAIPASDFAIDDRGRQRLLSAPVGGVKRRIEQKAEYGGEFDREMRREPLALGQATWCGQQIEHLGDELPARDCRTVQGDLTGGASITYGE